MSLIFVKTFGCTLNQKDTDEITKNKETIYDIEKIKKAKLVLINTCGVKEQTETKIIRYLKQLKELKIPSSKLIITGCLVTINKDSLTKIYPNAKYFEVSQKKELEKYIQKVKDNNKKNKSKFTTPIIIANGCLGNCSYCAVKFARGKLDSKSIDDIKKEVKIAIKNGAKEILLTAQDTGCYGLDINTNIVELLKEIIKIKKDFKIRLGMANPKYLEIFKKDLVEIFKSNKMYKFLHIPVQCGSNKVLKKMNRNYTKEEFIKLVKYFRKNIKNVNLATDIIVGFPTETEKDFNETVELLKLTKIDNINISRYGSRKNIEANKYKDIVSRIKKDRSRMITKIFEDISYKNNLKYKNKTKTIIINENGKNNTSIGRTKEYKTVVIEGKLKIGSKLKTKIIDASTYYLKGNKTN